MDRTPYVHCSPKDRLRKKGKVALTVLGVAAVFLFLFPPLGLILLLSSVMGFFLVNPGEIKGTCPACGSQVMGYLKSPITACNTCKIQILVNHETKEFSRFQ